jgi:hypothetical protein
LGKGKWRRGSSLGRFTPLTEHMQSTPAWRSLSPQCRAVYIEIARLYNGQNNGYLACSVRQLSERANINKDTASRCLATLVERGFLECAVEGGFSRKTRHAAEWRLTHYRCDRSNQPGSRAFQTWRPPIENSVRDRAKCCPTRRDTEARRTVRLSEIEGQPGGFRSSERPLVSDTYTSSHDVEGFGRSCQGMRSP